MKNPDLTRSLGTVPLTVETLAAGLAIDPTPADAVYIRNNLTTPEATGAWSVELSGTAEPKVMALDGVFGDLPRVELTTVLQCAGNGRRRLAEAAPGVQWDLGGMACVDWSGVRVADLIAAAGGPVAEFAYLTVLGSEAGAEEPTRVERSVPVADALSHAILADRLNGEPLPSIHGGPIRFVMPGYYAVNSVKWVRRIALTDHQTDAEIQAIRYRLVPPGEEPSLDHPPLWRMGPVAMILTAEPAADGILVSGVTFSGGDPIEGVDLTCDGDDWVAADLRTSRGPFGWRRFQGVIDGEGSDWVAARCRTTEGGQPRHSVPNRDGYAVDGWQDLAHRLAI